MNKELKEFLEKLFGDNLLSLAEGQEVSTELALSAVQSLVSDKSSLETKVTNLTTEKDQLTEQITQKDAEIANLTAMSTVGKNYIASLREEVVGNYKKLKGEKVDETIVTMLNAETTGIQTLISLNKDYKAQLDEKFPLTCSMCGSHEVTHASSVIEEPKQEGTTYNEEVPSTNSVIDNLYRQKMYNKENK